MSIGEKRLPKKVTVCSGAPAGLAGVALIAWALWASRKKEDRNGKQQ